MTMHYVEMIVSIELTRFRATGLLLEQSQTPNLLVLISQKVTGTITTRRPEKRSASRK